MNQRATTVPWPGCPAAPAPLAAVLRGWCRGARVQVVDEAGAVQPFGPLRWWWEAMRWLVWWSTDTALVLLAALITPKQSPPIDDRAPHGDGPVVLVLPVLPDLSHTFVYREALALLRQRPAWRVVALEHNRRAPVHPEAAELLQRAVFVPRLGITRRALTVLRWLGSKQGRDLFALYRSAQGGRVRDLLGKNPLRESRHPGRAFELADLLAGWQPRALHVYGSTYAANVAMGAAMLLSVPFSLTSYVDFEFPYAHKLLTEKVARGRFFRVCTQCCARALHAMLPAVTRPVPVIYFGLDLQRWQQRSQPRGQGVLLSVARLVEKKGLHLVPAALAELRRRGIPCAWRVVGDGPELPRLQQLVQQHGLHDHVQFLGPLDNAAVRREIATADLALLPCIVAADGERDGIPIFLTEAMALGVPAVTTPVGGIPELVRDGDTGYLAAPGDSASLANVLARALTDTATTAAIGERGRAEVHATQDVEHGARQLLACLEERTP